MVLANTDLGDLSSKSDPPRKKMKRRIKMQFKTRNGVFLFVALAAIPGRTLAQETAAPSDKKASEVRTLTGCLQKGDGAHEYALTAKDGSTWEIKSASVKLYPHVGQTVTVTGLVSHPDLHKMKEDAKDEMKEHGVAKDATEHGHLRATKIALVRESCQL
ncbi:MAG TPA: hypothetical protein VIW93_13245 [Candidatus Acidoferrum sp.]